MSLPFTLENIKPRVSDVVYQQLALKVSDADLRELSSPEGRNYMDRGELCNAQIRWHRDETDEIDGIFLRIFDHQAIQAWKCLKDQDFDLPYELTVTSMHTTATKIMFIHQTRAKQLFDPLLLEKSEDSATFDIPVDTLKTPEEIRGFFGKNREMLPASIREVVSPCLKPPEGLPRPRRKPNFIRIGLVLLLIVGVAYVVKRSFTQSKPTPPKTPPTTPTKPKTPPSIPAKPPLATPPIIEPKSSRHWGPVGSSAK